MAWCEECWNQERKTLPATKVLDESDLCDLHYRKALGEGLPAVPKNVPPMPPALGTGMPIAPKNAAPDPPNSKAVDIRLPPPVTVATASIPAATTAGEVRPKEKESMANKQRLCACRPGCTEIAKSNASPYAKGHNPDAKKKATPAPHNGKDKRPAAIRGGAAIERRRGVGPHSAYGHSTAPWRASGRALGTAQPAGESRQAVSEQQLAIGH